MRKEVRTVCYDDDLKLEAYRLEGIVQPFPAHFHEYYVIGFVEAGERVMTCNNQEYPIAKGDILLFNPGDSHSCIQSDGGTFDYRGFNITQSVMSALILEITGTNILPRFAPNMVRNEELSGYLRPLHQAVMAGSSEFEKEELLLFLVSALITQYGQPFDYRLPECREEIVKACAFIEVNFREAISLDQICKEAALSKSTLLRAFTKAKGVTPYRYLETIRIQEAKRMLEQGRTPIETAAETGFSDQSHFTNFFSRFIGLSPGAYRAIFIRKQQEEKDQ